MKRRDLHESATEALKTKVDWKDRKKTLRKTVIRSPGAVGVVEESFKPTEISNLLIQVKGNGALVMCSGTFLVEITFHPATNTVCMKKRPSAILLFKKHLLSQC